MLSVVADRREKLQERDDRVMALARRVAVATRRPGVDPELLLPPSYADLRRLALALAELVPVDPPPPVRLTAPAAERQRLLAETAAEAVARGYGLTLAELRAHRRDARTCHARALAMFAARRAGLSLPQIGALFDRHHTTVMHALRRNDVEAIAG